MPPVAMAPAQAPTNASAASAASPTAVSSPITAGASNPPAPDQIQTSLRPLDAALQAELQQLLDDTVASGFVPSTVLSVSIPGYLPWSGASGVADRDRALPMEPDTLIHLASITKMFTAVVVLQLAEEGKIDLDAPISTWLPDVVRFADTMTVRHLLRQTTGIYDYLEDPQFFVPAYENPNRSWTPAELVQGANQFEPAFRPGVEGEWDYSSTNYVILGMLVEQVTGRSLQQEMRERIFAPLGFTHTFFAPDEAIQGTLAQGYVAASDRVDVSMSFVWATGNLISTADELRQFADALFGDRLLRAESRAQMEVVMETGGAYAMPELRYGLGLMEARLNVGPEPDGTQRLDAASEVLGHIGGVAGFRSAVWRVRDSGITIGLSLNQADIDPNLLARDVLDTILTWQGR